MDTCGRVKRHASGQDILRRRSLLGCVRYLSYKADEFDPTIKDY